MSEVAPGPDLEAIEARNAARTQGKWIASAWDGGHCQIEDEEGYNLSLDAWYLGETSNADVEFIIQAPEDVTALLALVKEQQQRIVELEAEVQRLGSMGTVDDLYDDIGFDPFGDDL